MQWTNVSLFRASSEDKPAKIYYSYYGEECKTQLRDNKSKYFSLSKADSKSIFWTSYVFLYVIGSIIAFGEINKGGPVCNISNIRIVLNQMMKACFVFNIYK